MRSGLLHFLPAPSADGSPAAGPRRTSSDTIQTDSIVAGREDAEGAAAAAGFESLDLPRALALLLDVARGMAYLHARSVGVWGRWGLGAAGLFDAQWPLPRPGLAVLGWCCRGRPLLGGV